MTDCNGFNLENIGNTLKALSDVASQTDEVSVPLPYPANLLYAQNMLAISMSALQSLELNIAQIHLYLREHELRTAAVSAASAKLAISAAGFKVTIINPASVGAGSGAQAAGVAAGVQEPREVVVVRGRPWEPPAGGQDAPPAEAMHRRRLAVAVKIAVVMFFFEFRIGWWVLYFFGIFLYIGGLFDPFIEWIQSHSLQATLEQQLLNLQQRQRRADDLPGAQPDAGASEDPGTGAQPGSSQGSSEGLAGNTRTSMLPVFPMVFHSQHATAHDAKEPSTLSSQNVTVANVSLPAQRLPPHAPDAWIVLMLDLEDGPDFVPQDVTTLLRDRDIWISLCAVMPCETCVVMSPAFVLEFLHGCDAVFSSRSRNVFCALM